MKMGFTVILRSLAIRLAALFTLICFIASLSIAQTNPGPPDSHLNDPPASSTPANGVPPNGAAGGDTAAKTPATARVAEQLIGLHVTSRINLPSEAGGAFMPPVKCDADGNLYIRKFAPNRPLGSVVKIDPEGKPTGLFAPAMFPGLALDRIDAFSVASDGGIYEIAHTSPTTQGGATKPRVFYLLHYSSDGSPSSPSRLDSDFEVYTFGSFQDGSVLVSGVQRDVMDKNDHGRGMTKVFSSDGRELAQVTLPDPNAKAKKAAAAAQDAAKASGGAGSSAAASSVVSPAPVSSAPKDAPAYPVTAEKAAGALDLKDAEVGRDGDIYVMRTSSQALVDIVTPGGKVSKTLKITTPVPGAAPNSFHVSENRIALLFQGGEQKGSAIDVVDGQTGRRIAAYANFDDLGNFACYSANDGVFTFLKHGDGNTIEVIHAEAQ